MLFLFSAEPQREDQVCIIYLFTYFFEYIFRHHEYPIVLILDLASRDRHSAATPDRLNSSWWRHKGLISKLLDCKTHPCSFLYQAEQVCVCWGGLSSFVGGSLTEVKFTLHNMTNTLAVTRSLDSVVDSASLLSRANLVFHGSGLGVKMAESEWRCNLGLVVGTASLSLAEGTCGNWGSWNSPEDGATC